MSNPTPLEWQLAGNPLSSCPLFARQGDRAWVRAHDGLHVRNGASVHANILGNLAIGTEVTIATGTQLVENAVIQWADVDTPIGKGHVDAGFLSLEPVRPALMGGPQAVPPTLVSACLSHPALMDAWKAWADFPRMLCAIGCLESDLRTRSLFGGALVSRFEPSVAKRIGVNDAVVRRLEASSWGAMQVMGFHWKGYPHGRTCKEWLQWMASRPEHEWMAGALFLLERIPVKELAQLNWRHIATVYNGAGERKVALAHHRTPYEDLLAARYEDVQPLPYHGKDLPMAAAETHVDKPVPPPPPESEPAPSRTVVPSKTLKQKPDALMVLISEMVASLRAHWRWHMPLTVTLNLVTIALVTFSHYTMPGRMHDVVQDALAVVNAVDDAEGDADAASQAPTTIGPAPTPADVYQSLTNAFRLHDAPDVNSNSQGTLPAGTEVKRLGCNDAQTWSQVEVMAGEHEGKTGWVSLRDDDTDTASGLTCSGSAE